MSINLLPEPCSLFSKQNTLPSFEQCKIWWTKYDMLPNIQKHSQKVADITAHICRLAAQKGHILPYEATISSALLHDIAKTYCIKHGGSHNQLGAQWALNLTKNPLIASGVYHHIHWPFELDIKKYFLQLTVFYADKRVSHDTVVTLDDRFDDIIVRYGIIKKNRGSIDEARVLGHNIEKKLNELIGVNLACESF